MFYISGRSVRTAVGFSIKMVGTKVQACYKTEKVMAGKALKFVCIKCDLITSRQVLNTSARLSGKGIFDCQI